MIMCDFSIEELVGRYPEKAKLPCAAAQLITELADTSAADVGKFLNEKKISITYCQLGLFGYGRKGKSSYKITGRPVEVDASIIEKIKAKAANGRITCIELWNIADAEDISRAEIGNAADSLGIKIKSCQLGAFK
jgi:hypothetical protein